VSPDDQNPSSRNARPANALSSASSTPAPPPAARDHPEQLGHQRAADAAAAPLGLGLGVVLRTKRPDVHRQPSCSITSSDTE
jgi:hypothetical protein